LQLYYLRRCYLHSAYLVRHSTELIAR